MKLANLWFAVFLLFVVSCEKDDVSDGGFYKEFGGTDSDVFKSIVATPDGGFIAAGYSSSNDGDVTGLHGETDGWLMKIDGEGNKVWSKLYGGKSSDVFSSIIPTADGHYMVAGTSRSSEEDVTGNHGEADGWLMKVDGEGKQLWSKLFGGSQHESFSSVVAAPGGGYLLSGSSYSNDGDVSGLHSDDDAWLLKVDANGNILWSKLYGGNKNDFIASLALGSDGGYLAAGYSTSNDGDVGTHYGITSRYDAWLLKLDQGGGKVWSKVVGGWSYDEFYSVAASGADFVVTGRALSDDGDLGSVKEGGGWVIKTDPGGTILWNRRHEEIPSPQAVLTTTDGYLIASDYIIDGASRAPMVAKLDPNGTMLFKKTVAGKKDWISTTYSIVPASNNYCILAGFSVSGNITSPYTAWITKVKLP